MRLGRVGVEGVEKAVQVIANSAARRTWERRIGKGLSVGLPDG